MKDIQVTVAAVMEAGAVPHSPSIPRTGEYTIARHNYNAVSLLMLLHPDPSPGLIKAVLWSGVPRRWLGTTTDNALQGRGQFARLFESLCRDIERKLEILQDLTAEERVWLGAVDKTAQLITAKEQLLVGNASSMGAITQLSRWFDTAPLPKPVAEFVKNHRQGRLSDDLPK